MKNAADVNTLGRDQSSIDEYGIDLLLPET
jgi:hypothetical protein